MTEKIINIIKKGCFTIPYVLFLNYKDLKISDEEFILLIYLLNTNNNIYNPPKIAEVLNVEVGKVLELVNELVQKDILILEIKVEDNVHVEYISLENLYTKLAFYVINEKVEPIINENIYDCFEKELGRPLSPIEFELINGWQSNKINDDLILLALKEAVYNGAISLRYIDRILFDWIKKGIKTKDDVQKEKQKFKKKKDNLNVFDYDWLNENETN